MIILDTHAWLWWINQDPKLKTTWLEAIEQADKKFKLYERLRDKLVT